MRARIDVSEIEAQTKIRAKYLRALENEEWDLLPGPTFVRSFLRTYATALGLDGRALVEEYRLHHESPSEAELQPIGVSPQRRPRASAGAPARSPSRGSRGRAPLARGYVIALAVAAVLVVLLLGGILASPGSNTNTTAKTTPRPTHRHHHRTTATQPTQVVLRLLPTAPVYVCLIGDGNRKLIPGQTLQPGSPTQFYRATRFVMKFGNSSLSMHVDGHVLSVPASSNPIGYVLTPHGRHQLPTGQLPTCM